jgi:hypothetical protein
MMNKAGPGGNKYCYFCKSELCRSTDNHAYELFNELKMIHAKIDDLRRSFKQLQEAVEVKENEL